MYKVVLIDDESIIVEGLKRVVDWARWNCQVVGDAWDAKSGAALIRQQAPDILITDIHMPGEDGLAMLAGLKSEFPRMQVTVLTGYRDFEYATRALHLGVQRFLLKPSKMEEVEEAVGHMVENLEQLPPHGQTDPESEGESESGEGAGGSFLARRAKAFIGEHCAEKISLQDVADHCYISQWHLSKLLHKHLGQNFYDILNAERVGRAKLLLEEPVMRISEIAAQVGYADTAHFSRVFKKVEGISANEWRNQRCGVR